MAKRIAKTKEQYQAAVRAMTRHIKDKMAEIVFQTEKEFYDFCINVLAFAVERAPVEWGDLRGTAFLEMNGNTVAMGNEDGSIEILGGPVLDEVIHARVVFPQEYALIQHEHPEFEHPRGGQAYYLEVGFNEALREFTLKMQGR